MGAFLAKPVTDKVKVSGKGESFTYGGCSMQGWRVDMEDAHTVEPSLTIGGRLFKSWSFFAVFDGHAGANAAKVSSTKLIETILSTDTFKNAEENKYDPNTLAEAIKEAFLKLDLALRDLLQDRSGTTCTALLITPQHFLFINCGDSRSVLSRETGNENSNVHFATNDHKPTNQEEKQRIQAAGGVVITQRINGSLAVSRALGDFDYKEEDNLSQVAQLVSPEPEITIIERNREQDQFICLACDGIYDVFSNEDLVDYTNSQMKIRDDLDQISCDIIDTSLHKGSRDNMSVILLKFAGGHDPDETSKKADKDLEQLIEDTIEARTQVPGFRIRAEPIHRIMADLMNHENIVSNLPPGGGIHAKQAYLEELLDRRWPYVPPE